MTKQRLKEAQNAMRTWKGTKYDLLPCPFCGSDRLRLGHAHSLTFHVQCCDCGASCGNQNYSDHSAKGEDALNRVLVEDSVQAWNRRTE